MGRPGRRLPRAALLILAAVYSVAPAAKAAEEDPVARGERVFAAAGCYACHTDVKGGGGPLAGGRALKTPFGIFHTPNITPDRETGIGAWGEADFIRALREGLARDGGHYFPAFPYASYSGMSDRDAADLWAYLRTVPPARRENRPHDLGFPFGIRALVGVWKWLYFAPGRFRPDPARGEAWNRGAYLVQALGHCGECHTPRDLLGGPKREMVLAGTSAGPEGGKVPNITPDEETGIGKWSEGDIVSLLEIGMTPDGDVVGDTMGEVVRHATGKLPKEDLKAIAIYLKSIPAVRNRVSSGR
ncbi:MAG: cytochrome c [Proteobacteria bacterium]|nr:cytochrome c [Pseudomonadota bacterium]